MNARQQARLDSLARSSCPVVSKMLCRGAVQGTMAKFDTCDDWIIQGMIMIMN